MLIRFIRFMKELAHESYQVGRPAMGFVASSLYLYNNETATIWMALYFAFFYQLNANSGNDYMDWERDQQEVGREFSVSRGKASSKNRCWWYYTFTSGLAALIAYYDPFFGPLYFALHEFIGQCLYNGIFLGYPLFEISIIKRHGFPLDVPIAAWTYMPFSHLAGARRWFPSLTVSAWGTTMLWAQLKDYEHEKNTKVNTTATVLGPTLTRLVIAGAAVVMMVGDPRLFVYGLYTCYACWAYPRKFGKMSVVMALNLCLVVVFDSRVDAFVKFTCFGIQLGAAIWHYALPEILDLLVQKYYAFLSIKNRHQPYDPAVWDETDPQILLWKVGGLLGRSGTAVMGLFDFDTARLAMMGFVYFRAQDSWADLPLDRKDRLEGLKLVPDRLTRLYNGETNIPQDKTEHVRWNYEAKPRNKVYVELTKNVHRFDPIFLALPAKGKKILLDYAVAIGRGWAELEMLSDAPVTPELHRKHAEVALDYGYWGLCEASGASDFRATIDPSSGKSDPKVSASYIEYSDFIWFLNLSATIEGDVAEGVALHEDLRKMIGIEQDVIDRVRVEWLVHALKKLLLSREMLLHPLLLENWPLRLFTLQFTKVSVGVCEKYLLEEYKSGEKKHSAPKELFKTFTESLTAKGYVESTCDALSRAQAILSLQTEANGHGQKNGK